MLFFVIFCYRKIAKTRPPPPTMPPMYNKPSRKQHTANLCGRGASATGAGRARGRRARAPGAQQARARPRTPRGAFGTRNHLCGPRQPLAHPSATARPRPARPCARPAHALRLRACTDGFFGSPKIALGPVLRMFFWPLKIAARPVRMIFGPPKTASGPVRMILWPPEAPRIRCLQLFQPCLQCLLFQSCPAASCLAAFNFQGQMPCS